MGKVANPNSEVVALLHRSGVVLLKDIPDATAGELFYSGTSKHYTLGESEQVLDSIPAAVSLNLHWVNNGDTVLARENQMVLPDDTLTVNWSELFPNN